MVKWGIVGTGKIAYDVGFAIQSIKACQLVAVSSRNMDNAKKYATRMHISTFLDDYKTMIALDIVEVVYISTPNALHAELIEFALQQGKHVLCEKPMVVQSAQLEKLKELAAQKQLFLMEAMWTMFMPSVRYLLTHLAQIGSIKMVQGSMGFVLEKERCFKENLGGGALLDLGIYLISLTYALLGQPNHLVAQTSSRKGDVETSAGFLLKYDDAVVNLTCSFDVQLDNSFTVYGEKGSLTLKSPFYRSAIIQLEKYSSHTENVEDIRNDFRSFGPLKSAPAWKQRIYDKLHLGKSQIIIPFRGNGYQYQIQEVVDCLRTHRLESAILPIDHSIQVIKIIEKLRNINNEKDD